MDFKNFAELAEMVKKLPQKTKVAVVAAQEYHTLEAVSRAVKEGLIDAVLIGDKAEIVRILHELGELEEHYTIIQAQDAESCMKTAAELVDRGEAGCIMKGKLETGQLMRGILNKENRLRKSGLISLTGFYESPYYHKMFAVSDVAINVYPDFETKAGILSNAVDILHKVGLDNPKVACLCAVEKVNPKMKETVEAAQLKELNETGQIAGCIVEGPISFDLAVVKESAEIKGYDSPVAGDADLLLVPDLVSGNLLVKGLTEIGGAMTGGILLGAKVPVILVSRAAKASDKYNSIALAAYAGRKEE